MRDARIFFVNRFYWPDEPATAQLLTDLAEGLSEKGFPISIVARASAQAAPAAARPSRVEVLRVPTTRLGGRNLVGRAIDFACFVAGAHRALAQRLMPGDVVVTLTDPPLIGPSLSRIIRRRGARQIHWVQDIFPEVAVAVSGSRILGCFSAWRDRSWKNAARCVVPGQDMADYIQKRGVASEKIAVSPNWAPAGVVASDGATWKRQQGLDGKFVVMYSGNLGRVHDFQAIIPLAREFSTEPNVVFVFVGGGARLPDLEKQTKAAALSNVRFLPQQPRDSLNQVLSAGDLHLITLRRGCETYVFPSKLYGIAAVNRPALVIARRDADICRIVGLAGFGQGFESDQISEMARYIRQLMSSALAREKAGMAAKEFNRKNGGGDRAVTEWLNVLRPLIPLAAAKSGEGKSPAFS